jgi:serine/threonine protein kinase
MTAAHPSDEQLSHYGLGKLAGAANETVEAHITTCADCRQRVANLSADGFVDRLKRAAQPEAMSGFEASQPPVEKSTVFSGDDANIPAALLTLSMYKDVRRLGHGGMGEIFLARNVHMDREEVLKVMSKSMLERSGAAARFRREIRSVGQLNHANIVTTYGVQQVGDTVVLSMEYAGEDLAKHLEKRGPLPVARACYYIHQAALGLQFAHEKGLVHRDIKPSNLMVLQNGAKWQVKILDFGLAKSRTEPSDISDVDHQTKTGQSLGTPAYMAPEQIRDAKSVDIRADIYALGCTLYYLLTGRPPFVEDNIMSLIFAHGEKIPQPTNELRADVPVALAELIAKMLAKDPKDRPQSPAEVAKALVPFIRPGAKPSEAVTTASQAETDVASQTQPIITRSDSPPPSRKRWPAVALGLVLLVVGAAAVGSLFIQTKDGTIELTELDPEAAVYVDGNKVTVKWADGKQVAEIRAKPGTRKIEVKQGDITVLGETVEVESNGRKVLSARQKFEPLPKKPAVPNPGTNPPEPKSEFTPLFNGKDLTGWETSGMGPGSWRVENGVLVGSFVKNGGGTILTWPKGLAPRHYHLRLVLKKSDDWAALIALFCDMKYAANNKNPGVWPWGGPGPGRFIVYTGCTTPKPDYEVGRLAYVTGNSRDSAPLLGGQLPIANNEWYTMDIIVQGQRVTVDVNGTRRADYTDPDLPPEGRPFTLGCPGGATVQFKSVEYKELSAPAAAPKFVSLFNGKQVTGLRSFPNYKGTWAIEDGLLVLRGIRNPRAHPAPANTGVLESTRTYRDFVLRIEHAPLEPTDRSLPIIVRLTSSRIPFTGYHISGGGFAKNGSWISPGEIQQVTSKADDDDDDDRAQTSQGFRPVEPIRNKPYTIEITAMGNRISTSVDGVKVHELTDPSPTRGPIRIQAKKATRVRYQKIEIQDLAAPNAKEPAPEVLQPVDPPAPEVDRTARIRGAGKWSIEGEVLTGRAKSSAIEFGDPKWTDYEMQFDSRVIEGPPEVSLSVRRHALSPIRGPAVRFGTEWKDAIDLWEDGSTRPIETVRKPLRHSDWKTARLRVRDNWIEFYIGPTEIRQTNFVFKRALKMPPAGQVEFGIGYPAQQKEGVVQFKNILVKSLDGKILWEGLPELPAP